MHAFGATGSTSSTNLLDAVDLLETANSRTGEFNAQEADAACIDPEIQDDVGALVKETARQREIMTDTGAEPERHINALVPVHEAGIRGRPQLEELPSKLKKVPYYDLAVANSLILKIPWELMVEIFEWHMLMGGRWTTTSLVCKWWTMVAYTSPRLWARITVTNQPQRWRYLRGSVVCTDHDYLRLVLSRSCSHPLQLELSFTSNQLPHDSNRGTSSLTHGPQAANNCTMAIKLVLSDQILRRCTTLVLFDEYLPFDHLNTTVLPLLSSIRCVSRFKRVRDLPFIQSLVNLSPALRHIHSHARLSAENQGVGLWTKRIESYVRIGPSHPCYSLHESPSLRRLEVYSAVVTPLILPALQILRWSIVSYSSLHLITAPRLHTLMLCHGRTPNRAGAGPISFPNLRVAVHTWVYHPTDIHMFHTPALEHLSIEYGSSYTPPIGLLELFDGCAHMPKPKSLYLDCTFTEAGLIAILGRLPWLEELRIAGTGLRETFWEGLTPSYNSVQQVSSNDIATHILIPKLKALLVNNPTRMQRIPLSRDLQGVMEEVPNDHQHPDVDVSREKGWMAKQALIVAAARRQAGYPLKTLAYWSPERKFEVLIGSLESILNIPTWDDDWSVVA